MLMSIRRDEISECLSFLAGQVTDAGVKQVSTPAQGTFKPLCHTCTADELECEGYDEPDTTITIDQLPVEYSDLGFRRDNVLINPLPLLRRGTSSLNFRLNSGPSLIVFPTPADAFLLHHANQFLFKDSVRFDDPAGFWYKFALPLSNSAEPIKQALCALGGAHRSFVGQQVGDTVSYSRLAVTKYNDAVNQIKQTVTTNTVEHLQVSMVCCIIFVYIESLHGRVPEAIKHLQAGCLILSALRKYHTDKGSVAAFVPTMSTVLLRIWQDFADFQAFDTFYLPDLEPQIADIGDPTIPFPDAITAMEMLFAVDDVQSYLALSHHSKLPKETDSEDTPDDIKPLSLSHDSIRFAFQSSKPTLQDWISRMGLFLKQHEKTAFPKDEQHRVQTLSLYHTLCTGLAKLDSLDDELAPEDCHAILEKLALLFQADAENSGPTFALGGHLIPIISRVFGNVSDEGILRQCIEVLRSVRRREGVWDSHRLADLYEAAMNARPSVEELGEELPFGVPQLTEKLATLGLLPHTP
ncbi:unnamed protein product [Clonostachys byssicola]|uniref:Uncharacterized protein n=1 Tax=Clonostachys byssicola TaxID=160290 RepID=A0A9N9UBM1_9HYPO|nr:unnamed protein product [Clonostachys byssicola]